MTDGILELFLEQLAQGHTVSAACKTLEIGRATVYDQRERDEAFRQAWSEALDAGIEVLEEEARRRALGFEQVSTDKDGNTFTRLEHSDRLLEFLLKAKRPAVYRDRSTVEHTGAGGGPIQLVSIEIDPEEVTRGLEELGLVRRALPAPAAANGSDPAQAD